MTYTPLLPRDLDFPEILALRAPAATMVLNDRDDHLFTLAQMKRADRMIADTFERAGAAANSRCEFYDGPHTFDLAMQEDAFTWLDAQLKNKDAK
ncbi:MAG: hypothetical protein ACKODH_05055 [Limisphaerales bacterium]